MKIRFCGFSAFNIAAIYNIARTKNFSLSMVLIASLLLTNIIFAYVFFRIPSLKSNLSGCIVTSQHWLSWTDYIPVFGGIICVFIGVFELTWKPCVIGAVTIAIGIWRIWAKGRARQELRDRR